MKTLLLFSALVFIVFSSSKSSAQQNITNKVYHINSISELEAKISELNKSNEEVIDVFSEGTSAAPSEKYMIFTTVKQSESQKYKEYKLVYTSSPENLDKECKKALADGYSLVGGAGIALVNTNMFYIQGFAK